MKAILSDVHGNLEALQAVLDDAERHRVEAIYCLGDLVGYGPNPRECVDLAMRWKVVLLGDYDRVILDYPPKLENCSIGPAADSAVWSQAVLEEVIPDKKSWDRRWGFLRRLEPRHENGDLLLVHGSPRNPLYECVFPEEVYNGPGMAANFGLVRRYCFCDHTHVPGVITEDLRFVAPVEVADEWFSLGKGKAIVNVGSVGQPRDGDWRACYVLLDGEFVRFRRLEYDVETTVRKIREVAAPNDWLGDRLRDGR